MREAIDWAIFPDVALRGEGKVFVMRTRAGVFLAAMWGLLAASVANGAVIELVPSTQEVSTGDSFSLDIVASDLDGRAVGYFDLVVEWSSTSIVASDFEFGYALGREASFEALEGFFRPQASDVQLTLFSLLPDAELLARQASGSVLLGTLVFDAVSPGEVRATVSRPENGGMWDERGRRFILFPRPARVDVVGPPVRPIPEPTAALVFAVGLAVVGLATRRADRREKSSA